MRGIASFKYISPFEFTFHFPNVYLGIKVEQKRLLKIMKVKNERKNHNYMKISVVYFILCGNTGMVEIDRECP